MGEVAMVGIFYLVPRVSCRVGDKEMGGSGMEKAAEFRVVLVTCGSTKEARKIATAVVEKRLAACVNIVGGTVESIYWWKGKVETGRERLLILKTAKGKLKKLEAEVRRLHSYEVPEFLVVGVEGGAREYLNWMLEVVG
jgi:periplasmic divalent cation tolerance protein